MEKIINARISNRHVHLTKEVFDKLFDGELTIKTKLNQVGEFAANETLTIIVGNQKIENVRVVGPLRKYTQIEISKRDARFLGVNPPVRRSGNLENTPKIVLETSKGSVETDGLIIANRHVHMTPDEAKDLGVEDKQIIKIKIDGEKSGIVDAEVKVSDNGYLELHIDTDDANAFLLQDNDKVTMIL